jgi:hypothetical protein
VDYYNTRPVGYDAPFLLSRLAYALVGLGAVAGSVRHFGATLRGAAKVSERRGRATAEPAPAVESVRREVSGAKLASLGMTSRAPGFVRTVLDVAAFEGRNVASQPGLYIFVPLILLQVIGSSLFQVGAFDTPLLLTPGTAAVGSMNTLTLLVCFLLLFYTTESVLREKAVRLEQMFWATPSRTGAVLLGKAIANGLVGFVILVAAWVGSTIVILVQGKVHPAIGPYVLVWGALLLPTFIAWASFVTAIIAATGDRWMTYSLGLATIAFTGWRQFKQAVNWVGNWDLWSAAMWTDFGGLDPNGSALLLNRAFYLAVTAFLIAWTVRFFPRREPDSGASLDRLRPGRLVGAAVRLSPIALPAVVLGALLYVQVSNGFQGKAAERREKEYHGRNLVTWEGVKGPVFGDVDLDLQLQPSRRFFRVKGSYALVNRTEKPMRRFPMSVGDHFEKMEWTLGGQKFVPEDRARLEVFNLSPPLAVGDTARVGFSYEGRFPKGITKNGGGMGQFILPSGVVLTSFGSEFLPMPFFEDGRGVKEENRLDPKDYEDGFWEGVTPPGIGSGALFPVRTRITGPAGWDYHGVGVRREDTTANGKRTVVWETDHPVNFFNVIAGKWAVWKGEGVEVNYLAAHKYNVEEIGQALVAARRWYSEWFYPYPWADLRLNEFPGLAGYAQGFPTNITFSERIGFLTRSKPEAAVAFLVTAHESAHQWWGNILLPGEGPGGNVLAEGMAHFSTILLYDQVKGPRERIEFCKAIEHRYGDRRQVDSEKPLAWIDGSKDGDETATYDKGGWAAWMLYRLMGKEANLAGLHDFIERYHASLDHPVVEDFTAVMREHAPDVAAYDDFVKQWYYSVVMPQYHVRDASKKRDGDAWTVQTTVENVGTGRMPVEVAAVAGDRWPNDPGKDGAKAKHHDAKPWHETRTTVVLGAGEKADVTLHADFEPEKIVVDPDAGVLMLKRDQAETKL